MQRRVERLLDQIDAAEAPGDWALVRDLGHDVNKRGHLLLCPTRQQAPW